MTEENEENTEVAEELCDCETCRCWRDKENMTTGIITMPNDVYEAVVKKFPVLAEDYNQLKNQPMSAFFGLMALRGIAESSKDHIAAEIIKIFSEKLSEIQA